MYLQPPDIALLGMAPEDQPSSGKPNLTAALKLLEDHAHQIDVPKVCTRTSLVFFLFDLFTFSFCVYEVCNLFVYGKFRTKNPFRHTFSLNFASGFR
jgi:hypothetical protein